MKFHVHCLASIVKPVSINQANIYKAVTNWSLGLLPERATDREFSTWVICVPVSHSPWVTAYYSLTVLCSFVFVHVFWKMKSRIFLSFYSHNSERSSLWIRPPFIAHHSRTRLLGKRNSTTCSLVHRPVSATRVSGGERILYLSGDVTYEIAEDDW